MVNFSWSKRTENQIVVCYEDLFDQQVWRDLLTFYDIKIDENAFDRAIEMTQFNTIRDNLEEIAKFPSAWRYLAAENGAYDVVHPENNESQKFRRGKVGGYLDYLCQEDIDYILDNFSLGQNYPNPFNNSTNISFVIAEDCHVTLKVFDLLGKEILTAIDQDLQQGRHRIIINADNLRSGVYVYKLTAGTYREMRKFILLK